METIRIKKGHNANIFGWPSEKVEDLAPPETVAAVPEHIPFVKPRLAVAEGDSVKIGSILYVDKRNPSIAFCSPGGGTVRRILFGPRRVIREIVIDCDRQEAFEMHPALDAEALGRIDRSELVSMILKGGLWPLIRELPNRDIARPDRVPPGIIVSLDNREPFHPSAAVYLQGQRDLFRYGLSVLHRLAESGPVIVAGRPETAERFSGIVTHQVVGRYPADDPGALLYRWKTSPSQNRSWYVSGQDVLLLAHLLKTGCYPVERTVAVGGGAALERKHFRSRLGAPLSHLAGQMNADDSVRLVVGGIFTGYAGSAGAHMGLYETSLTLIPEGDDAEFLALFRPGFRKPTYSRLFLSRLHSESLEYDCNRHGGVRACIGCMHCADVCPVDILPQMAYKAVLVGEVEESLAHGLLDCVECGLCSYVCPSKIELTQALKDAKADYALERGE
ncbi:MAG: 4Fe-4S dicluster domain-containing protein [Desulfobacterales bacterium]|jgi:Na+-transporting NADH:ubiquinone oxidoreductase subunit A